MNGDDHHCHFCGEYLDADSKDSQGRRHWLSDCRPDLTEHEKGPLCTWAYKGECYAEHANGINAVYPDGPMV